MVKEAMMRKLPMMFVNCWVRLPQHEGNQKSRIAVLSKRASVDFQHIERLWQC